MKKNDEEAIKRHSEGMKVARAYASWHLGDPSWAGSIIEAYLHPETAQELLDQEKKEI